MLPRTLAGAHRAARATTRATTHARRRFLQDAATRPPPNEPASARTQAMSAPAAGPPPPKSGAAARTPASDTGDISVPIPRSKELPQVERPPSHPSPHTIDPLFPPEPAARASGVSRELLMAGAFAGAVTGALALGTRSQRIRIERFHEKLSQVKGGHDPGRSDVPTA